MDDVLYLDMAAATPLHPEVFNAMQPFFTEQFANPSSLHSAGQTCKDAIEKARQHVASYLNTPPKQIVWTSGGTESDNLAILGVMRALRAQGDTRALLISATEHSAVLEAARYLKRHEGVNVIDVPPNANGRISPETLAGTLKQHPSALVSIIHANNETGALNPIGELSHIAHEHGALFHTDAVQSFAKVPFNMTALPCVDYLSATAHKCGGPRGAGLLYMSSSAIRPHPVIIGGAQEQGLRGGTLNTPAIVGFGKAVESLSTHQHTENLNTLLDITNEFLKHLVPLQEKGLQINTPLDAKHRLPGIINVSLPGITGDAAVPEV